MFGAGALAEEGLLRVGSLALGLALGGPGQRLLGLDFPVGWLADNASLDKVEDLPLGVVAVFFIKPNGRGLCVELRAEAGPYVEYQDGLVCHTSASVGELWLVVPGQPGLVSHALLASHHLGRWRQRVLKCILVRRHICRHILTFTYTFAQSWSLLLDEIPA